ncbi:MAG TPA: hypothetical protein VF717_19325 [Pyrinomonadaceae bacterium]|jgi:hypothetical protein
MNDWVGLGIIVVIVAGGLYALMRANEPRKPLTEEEFQKRVQESSSLAGMGALQQALDPSLKRAQAVIEDMKQGYYDGEQESVDGKDTAPVSSDDTTTTDVEKERDA